MLKSHFPSLTDGQGWPRDTVFGYETSRRVMETSAGDFITLFFPSWGCLCLQATHTCNAEQLFLPVSLMLFPWCSLAHGIYPLWSGLCPILTLNPCPNPTQTSGLISTITSFLETFSWPSWIKWLFQLLYFHNILSISSFWFSMQSFTEVLCVHVCSSLLSYKALLAGPLCVFPPERPSIILECSSVQPIFFEWSKENLRPDLILGAPKKRPGES